MVGSVPLADTARCPCLSGEPYGQCCAPLHRGERVAATAEQLMRSRFSAFAGGDAAYLLATWHPSTRPHDLELDAAQRWYRLDILDTAQGGPLANTGSVEFIAYYRGEQRGRLHERSRFVRLEGRWLYLDAAA
ncbi:YchJ family protein [Rathayibacter sp. YIM 133350]|uniref:YchJ family protein n=1 Tax=Rathayibacter sp. YIM 133350 TaxID=3131992 RepID=UPI00307DCA09